MNTVATRHGPRRQARAIAASHRSDARTQAALRGSLLLITTILVAWTALGSLGGW